VLVLGEEVYYTTKFSDDELTDDQSEADTIRVDLSLLVLNRAKHLEKLVLVLFLDADAGVCHGYPQVIFLLPLDQDLDLAVSIGKLDSIRIMSFDLKDFIFQKLG
jgi:hypothetical protein